MVAEPKSIYAVAGVVVRPAEAAVAVALEADLERVRSGEGR